MIELCRYREEIRAARLDPHPQLISDPRHRPVAGPDLRPQSPDQTDRLLLVRRRVTPARVAYGPILVSKVRSLQQSQDDSYRSTEAVVPAVAAHIKTLPEQLRKSLTWDRGTEMARHAQFTIDTGVQVYFCDPRSPWQRGTNENTNGLLRQYFPKRTTLAGLSQADLDLVAAKLNRRPRKTLDWLSPAEKMAEVLR
jgi:transposase InsO family protein